MPGNRKNKIAEEFNRDTEELREIAELWVYRSQDLFPDREATKKLRTLFINRFGGTLNEFGSLKAFIAQLKYAKKYYSLDFTEIADNLIDDTDTLSYLESIDPSQFKYVYNKSMGPRDGYAEKLYMVMDSKGPVNLFDDIRHPVISYSLRQFNLYNESYGDPNQFDENRELVYLLPSEEILIERYKESLEGIDFANTSAEKNLEDLNKLLNLITPKDLKSPMKSIKDLIEALSREFTPKEAYALLENLEDDNYMPTVFEKRMMKSKNYKLLRSKHIEKYKDPFEMVLRNLKPVSVSSCRVRSWVRRPTRRSVRRITGTSSRHSSRCSIIHATRMSRLVRSSGRRVRRLG